ncbi:MAG: LysE family transporter [Bacteroidales bacterium]|jgi:threonine/homoserine/homoserine lactone efflux protein|nr:LysE family transporter [Bacteroidales bacterium]NLM91441.1 LysE family transporter [Bacteroidales bacterium]
MFSVLIQGVILGFTMAFLIGPTFISLVQTSIHRGFPSGVQFAMGVVLSDLVFIALSYLGALQIFQNESNQVTMGFIGGLILMGFGAVTFTRKYVMPAPVSIEVRVSGRGILKYVMKGFFMNIFNPFLLVFWIGVMGIASSKYSIPSREILVFFAGVIGTVFLTDIFKSFIAHRIKRYINARVLTIMNRVVGVCLVLFGIGLIIRVCYFM